MKNSHWILDKNRNNTTSSLQGRVSIHEACQPVDKNRDKSGPRATCKQWCIYNSKICIFNITQQMDVGETLFCSILLPNRSILLQSLLCIMHHHFDHLSCVIISVLNIMLSMIFVICMIHVSCTNHIITVINECQYRRLYRQMKYNVIESLGILGSQGYTGIFTITRILWVFYKKYQRRCRPWPFAKIMQYHRFYFLI